MIIDYGEECAGLLGIIVDHLVRSGLWSSLSIWDFCLDEGLARVLSKMGFRSGKALSFRRQPQRDVLPLLVRPVRGELAEEDWLVEGVDSRDIGSWSMKGICSDYY